MMMIIIILTPAVIAVNFIYCRVVTSTTVGFHISPVHPIYYLPGWFQQTLIVFPTIGSLSLPSLSIVHPLSDPAARFQQTRHYFGDNRSASVPTLTATATSHCSLFYRKIYYSC
jgi:hypothetical protein